MSAAILDKVIIRHLPITEYIPVWQAMKAFTAARDINSFDEIWLLQHLPVFTLGQAGKPEHILQPQEIPVIQVDRGGQVTYHGPGQLVAYLLIDLKRRQLGVRQLVDIIEESVIALLAENGVMAEQRRDAPGVYVDGAKIAALGLRVKKGCAYHGLSLNIDMDLSPFARINPCGYAGLAVTQVHDHCPEIRWTDVEEQLMGELCSRLRYTEIELVN